jgi:hypothetical protein
LKAAATFGDNYKNSSKAARTRRKPHLEIGKGFPPIWEGIEAFSKMPVEVETVMTQRVTCRTSASRPNLGRSDFLQANLKPVAAASLRQYPLPVLLGWALHDRFKGGFATVGL